MSFLVKLPCDGEDYYLEWSSIMDASNTVGMTLEELEVYYKDEYGKAGLRELPHHLKRASAMVERLIYNRAGVGGSQLTLDEIADKYIRQPRAVE